MSAPAGGTELDDDRREALDLRGTPCPLNYVKTRVALERLPLGDALEVWLDHGEPATQVPRSLRMDGHDVAEFDGQGHVKLLVRRLV